MKVFLLAVLIIMLFYRVKHTPKMLNKRIWERETKSGIEKMKQRKGEVSSDEWNILKLTSIILTLLLYIIFILVYILVNIELNSKCIFVLSALQLVAVLHNLKELLFMKDIASLDIKDYKFHRFWNLFDVLLDYLYYPAAIVMLLM